MNQGVPLELMQMPPNELLNFLLVAEREMAEIDNAWACYDMARSQPIRVKHQFLVWLGVFLFVLLFCLFSSSILLFFVSFIAATIIWYIYRRVKTKEMETELDEAVFEAEQNAMTVTNQRARALLCVPEDYWHPSTLQIMINIMRTGRAANWSECAREYENEKHRLDMRSLSEESQTLQKKTLNAAKGAAVLSGLAAIIAAISASNNKR
jgi:Ca2+/Na+ antiporter